MADNLIEFLSYVNKKFDELKLSEEKIQYFRDFLCKENVAEKLFVEKDNVAYDLPKKLDVKFENLSNVPDDKLNRYFSAQLFAVNSANVKKYMDMRDGLSRNLACFGENAAVAEYLLSDENACNFVDSIVDLNEISLNGNQDFLFRLLFSPSLDVNRVSKIIDKMDDYSFRYDYYRQMFRGTEKRMHARINECDFICSILLSRNKLAYTWENLLQAFVLLKNKEKKSLDAFINNCFSQMTYLERSHFISRRTRLEQLDLLLYAFENQSIENDCFKKMLTQRLNLLVFDDLIERFFDDDMESPSSRCVDWSKEKCTYLLKCFSKRILKPFDQRSLLVCYLAKGRVEYVYRQLESIEDHRGIYVEERSYADRTRFKSDALTVVCAALLYNNGCIHKQSVNGSILDSYEYGFVLNRVNLTTMVDVVEIWKSALEDEKGNDFIKNFFEANTGAVLGKFVHEGPNDFESIRLLYNLIDIVDRAWMRFACDELNHLGKNVQYIHDCIGAHDRKIKKYCREVMSFIHGDDF